MAGEGFRLGTRADAFSGFDPETETVGLEKEESRMKISLITYLATQGLLLAVLIMSLVNMIRLRRALKEWAKVQGRINDVMNERIANLEHSVYDPETR